MIFWTRKQMEEEFARQRQMERIDDAAWQARQTAEKVLDRLKILEGRVEWLEGLLSKPLTRTERFFPDMMGECAKEDE